MANMPMPNGLTLFVMAGSKAAELAGNIVTSVQDHVSEESQYAISCFALVDDSFQEEKAVVDHVFYRYDSHTLEQQAAKIAIQKILEMNATLDQKGITHISLNQVNCVFVADANGAMSFDQLTSIARAIQRETSHLSINCEAFLCLLTDYKMPGNQHAWLMENGKIRSDMSLFQKMLLLSTKDIHGSLGARVEQSMRDTVAPALLLMLNGYELNDPTRLYTAAYNKTGGTSNDILELKRHIAAEVLDGFFANPNEAGDVWKFLSTADMDLTMGHSAAERANAAAERCVPTLECIAATADLEDKEFDPVSHVMAFDALNRDAMCELGDLPDRWADEMLERAKESLYLDALLAQLDDNGEIYKGILTSWRELFRQKKELLDPAKVAPRLSSMDKKKGLFAQWRDHNLQALSVTVSSYQLLCKERFALRILSCLQQKIPLIREELQSLIDMRKNTLAQYKQPENKVAVLMDENMCGRAAAQLKAHYAKTSVLTLNTFLNYGELLYQPEGTRHWRSLFREFVATSKITSSFADAFLQGKDQYGLQTSVQQLAQNVYPLIPDYPDALGALPTPSNHYLLNEAVADYMSNGVDYAVYGVPGDVMEHVALYRLGRDYSVLEQFKLFAPGMEIGNFGPASALQQRRSRVVAQAAAEIGEQRNPWGLRVKAVENGVQVSWNFVDTKAVFDILANGEIVEPHYDFKTFTNDGMVYVIPKEYMHGTSMRIGLCSGEETCEVTLNLERSRDYAEVKSSKTKAKNGDLDLFRCTAEYPEGADNKCLVIREGTQVFRVRLPLNGSYSIGPLWLAESVGDIELEDID